MRSGHNIKKNWGSLAKHINMNPANFTLSKEELLQNKKNGLHDTLHMPNKNREIYTKSLVEQLPTAWYGMHWGDFTCNSYEPAYTEDNELPQRVTYKLPDPNISSVKHVSLVAILPPIQVAEQFQSTVRVAWSADIALSIIEDTVVDAGGCKSYRLNRHSMKALLTAHKLNTDSMLYNIGKRPHLNEWSTTLPVAQVGFKQPFFFQDLESGLICYTERPVYFEYAFVLQVAKLLRCEVKDEVTGLWKVAKPERRFFSDFADKLQQPKLSGKFEYNSKFGVAMFRGEKTHSINFTDVYEVCAPNATDCRQSMQVTLDKERDLLVKSILVLIENVSARQQLGEWCQYSDNIIEVKISYDDEPRMIERSNSLQSRIINETHFGGVLPPWLKGLPYVECPFDNMESDIAFRALKGKVDILMHQDDDDHNLYRYRVFFVAQRVITYENIGNQKRGLDEDGPRPNMALKVSIQP